MDLLKHSSNIKAALFLLGFILVIFLFTYTQGIVNELRKDNGEIVKLYAEIIAQTISDENDTNLDFVFDEIIQKAQFPIIYSNNKKDPYKSIEYGILKHSVPDFIKKEGDLMKLINKIEDANIEDGGSVAFYVYLK